MFIDSSSTIITLNCFSSGVQGSFSAGVGGAAAAKDGNGGQAVLVSNVSVT